MDYSSTLEYLYRQLPMFHRIGTAAYKADLNNTLKICSLLGNPEKEFRSVHIAGTNGKGSVSHMLASILQEAGYTTGLFTSPHLRDFRERIRINGKMIPRKVVVEFVENYKEDFDKVSPSFFEWTWGLAAWYFARSKVDIAVIETGMGGRLDSTNVIHPELSVITNISHDHNRFLGRTLREIAGEKAGIIKHNTPVVIGEKQTGIHTVFREKAEAMNAPLHFAGDEYKVLQSENIALVNPLLRLEVWKKSNRSVQQIYSPLTGNYQVKNIPCVLMAADCLNEKKFDISPVHIRKGIRRVILNTGLRGRWQIIGRNPLTIADIAHNPAGISEVIRQATFTKKDRLHIVLGVVNDKDVARMLRILPQNASYYFCKADIPRGLDAQKLCVKAQSSGLEGSVYASVADALSAAKGCAGTSGLVLVTGSAFVVAEVV